MFRATIRCQSCGIGYDIKDEDIKGDINRKFHTACPQCDTENVTRIWVQTEVNHGTP